MKHFVLYKFKEGLYDADKKNRIIEIFNMIKEDCHEVKDFEVIENGYPREKNAEIMIVVNLSAKESLNAYLTNRYHLKLKEEFDHLLKGKMTFDQL